MSMKIKLTAAILFLGLVMTNFLSAQPYGKKYGSMYDPSTVESIYGTVTNIETVTYNTESRYGAIHIMVKTDKEEIKVHVGPSWFLRDNNFTISLNDNIELKGSRVTYDGETFIIAARMKIGDKSITLRDDDGKPLWSGSRYN